MQQFFKSISDFCQKVTNDGIPLWIVFIRDVVTPIFTILGGVFAFFIWNRRKKQEHKLMHKTKAYEILLDKEMKCYEELIPMMDKAYKKVVNVQKGDNKAISDNREVDIILLLIEFQEEINLIADFVTKNRIYMNTDINKACDEFIMSGCRYHSFYLSSFNVKDDNGKADELRIDKAFDEYSITSLKLSEQIKKHLEDISRIK